ncbi:MAG: hypothetical protein JW771_08000 [Candidatus Thermoplasmatota archaeon]|nr:hypothetical protein [Candidatus Thermoplasmatota archaeon]
MKKKIWTGAIVLGILLLGMASVVNASDGSVTSASAMNNMKQAEYQYRQEEALPAVVGADALVGQPTADVAPLPHIRVRFKGIWGDLGDNETKGYCKGTLGKTGRIGFLNGFYNTTNGSVGRVRGILKYGYFNGKIITPKGEKRPITGFYRIDQETRSLHIQWMTINRVGWAHLRISPIQPTVDAAD